VCTKAGYLEPTALPEGGITPDDIAGGVHCISPAFLRDQLRRSRSNLGLETIDVYYIHNPEAQLMFVSMHEFMKRIRRAFEYAWSAASDNMIRYYGIATWDGWRSTAHRTALSLSALAATAREVGGKGNRFRFVELPLNLSMPEARTGAVEGADSVLDVAARLNLSVVASATLLGARLSRNLPRHLAGFFPGLLTDAQRAIQFTRSTPGIASALVGMTSFGHLTENLALSRVPPLSKIEYQRLLASMY